MLVLACIYLAFVLLHGVLMLVLFARPRFFPQRWTLAGLLCATATWCAVEGLHHLLAVTHQAAPWIAQATLTARAALPVFLLLLPLPLLPRRSWAFRAGVGMIIISILGLFLPWTPLASVHKSLPFWGAYAVQGPAVILLAGWLVVCSAAAVFLIRQAFTSAYGQRRVQLKYLLSSTIFCLTAFLFDSYLSAISTTTPFFPGGLVGLSLLNITGVYMATQSRPRKLVEIIGTGVNYCIVVGVLLYLFTAVISHINGFLADTLIIPFRFTTFILVIITVGLLAPFLKLLRNIFNTIFYRNRINSGDVLDAAINAFNSTRDVPTLLRLFTSALEKTVHPQFFAFVLRQYREDGSEALIRLADGAPLPEQFLPPDMQDILEQQLDVLMLTDELVYSRPPFTQIGTQLAAWHIAVVVPLKVDTRINGFVFLGEKLSGDGYTGNELNLINALGKQLAIAVEHAHYYAQLQKINELLDLRIQQRTHELAEANTKLMEADQAKDEFLAIISHELLTPLTNILVWTELALDPNAIVAWEEALDVVKANALRQKRVVDDLLDASRAIHGKLVMDMHLVDLWSQVTHVTNGLLPRADEKGIILLLQPCEEVLPVQCDPVRMQQVISNLLANAIKFTPRGGVVSISGSIDDEHAVISVTDSGIGLANDQLQIIFEMFRQTNTSNGGLGLGLALAKHILDLHSGAIFAESAGRGYGSTFTFRIPLAMAPEEGEVLPVAGDSRELLAAPAHDPHLI